MPARLDAEKAAAIMRAASLEPLAAYPGTDAAWPCRCLVCGREVSPSLTAVKGGARCAFCSRVRVDPVEARAVMAGAGFEPMSEYPGAHKRWPCRCAVCGRESAPTYSNVRNGTRCGYCAGRRVVPEEAVTRMRAASLEPLEPYPGADALWRCRCEKCGREVRQSASNVKAGGSCVYCAGRRLDPDAVAATMAAADLEPLEDYRNADARWRCRCLVCGREVTPTWTQVKAGGRCAYCRGNRVDRTDAVRFMADAGLHPMEPFPGAHARWLCRCGTCGREVRQTYSKARTGRGCRYCASRGLDYSAAGVVYLVDHAGFFALKVGVSTTAATEERVATHARDGWALVGYWTVPSAEAAVVVERAVLRWWRETLHAPQALTAADMPRGGFTETASRLFVDSDRTVAFVRSLVESERATLPGSPH